MFIIKDRFIFLTIILQLFFFHVSVSQNGQVSFQHLSIENGLSGNTVSCIVQDSEGFIWLGTPEGLHKFNGYNSKIFRHIEGDSTSITSSSVRCIFKDKKNRLWFGGYGLSLYNSGKDRFINFTHSRSNPRSIGNDDITAITQDEKGVIWVGTRIGLYMFDEPTNTFFRFFHDSTGTEQDIYHKNRIIDLVPDMHGNLWVATINGLYRFSLSAHTFSGYYHDPKNKNTPAGNKILSLAMASNEKLWMVVADSGLSVYDIRQNQFTTINSPYSGKKIVSDKIEKLICDSKGKIWIATSLNGVMVFDPETKGWKNFLHDDFNPESLSDNNTQTIFEDLSGMIWIGMARHGVDRLSPQADKFTTYKLQPGKLNSLCEADITVAIEDKAVPGNLWIGSKNGLMYFDRTNNSFKCLRHEEHNSNGLSNNVIYSLSQDAGNNLWVATDDGLDYFNPTTNKWKHYLNNKTDSNSIPSNIFFDVVAATNGSVWVGTGSGFARINRENGLFDHAYNQPGKKKFIREYYTVVFEDSRHTLWLSTSRSGIINIDDSFHVIRSFRRSGGFDTYAVHQFAEDAGANIWMATDRGLYKWDRNKETFFKFNCKEGNLNADIKSVVIENDHTIWVSTSYGLTQLFIDKKNTITSTRSFNSSDGLQSNAFNNYAGTKLTSGEIFFGGINGFNIFFPDKIAYNTFVPPVHLFSFKIFDKEFNIQNKQDSGSGIVLNYKQNFFSFEIAALNYDHPEKNQFAYQLEGFDKEMIYCGTSHRASYTNVPPGKYVLHIIASNNDGAWTDVGERINLTIIPPFWQTNWFRILTIAGLVLLVYLFFYFRIRKIRSEEKKRSQINKQIAEARLAALSAQMNPHFIFNSLNSIQQFISESEKDNALKYLSKFSKLIRLVLQNAPKNSNSIADELNMLGFYLELEALRFSDKFTWHFTIDKNINKENTEIPSMLLQPFVENAVIHGLLNKTDKGHVEISILQKVNTLFCIIEDNGIGRAAANLIKNKKLLQYESLGMKVTGERMLMLEKIENRKIKIIVHDLKDDNGNGTGTKVEIEISAKEAL